MRRFISPDASRRGGWKATLCPPPGPTQPVGKHIHVGGTREFNIVAELLLACPVIVGDLERIYVDFIGAAQIDFHHRGAVRFLAFAKRRASANLTKMMLNDVMIERVSE